MHHADAEMKMGRARLEPVEISESILKRSEFEDRSHSHLKSKRGVADLYLKSENDLVLML